MDYINGRLTGINSINEVLEDIARLDLVKQDKAIGESFTTTVTVGNLPSGSTISSTDTILYILKRILTSDSS